MGYDKPQSPRRIYRKTNFIKKSAPKARKRRPAKVVPLVVTRAVASTRHQVVGTAMGTVIPAREVVLRSRVTGEAIQIHPEFSEGGFIGWGTEILRSMPLDNEFAIVCEESAIASV